MPKAGIMSIHAAPPDKHGSALTKNFFQSRRPQGTCCPLVSCRSSKAPNSKVIRSAWHSRGAASDYSTLLNSQKKGKTRKSVSGHVYTRAAIHCHAVPRPRQRQIAKRTLHIYPHNLYIGPTKGPTRLRVYLRAAGCTKRQSPS